MVGCEDVEVNPCCPGEIQADEGGGQMRENRGKATDKGEREKK